MHNPSQTALITGASSGIGLEIAKILRTMNYNLVLVSRTEGRLAEAQKALPNGKGSVVLIPCDLSHEGAARILYAECQKRNIAVDILVNNAGFGLFGQSCDFETDKLEDLAILNVVSLTTLCNLFGKDMKKRRSGYIMNVASTASYQPIPYLAAYAASKSYVFSFSQSLSKELEEYGVNVTCLNPGPTQTGFFAVAGFKEKKEFLGLKTRMNARDVAAQGIKAMFARKRVVIPGLKNRVLAFWGYLLPRSLVLPILRIVLQKELRK